MDERVAQEEDVRGPHDTHVEEGAPIPDCPVVFRLGVTPGVRTGPGSRAGGLRFVSEASCSSATRASDQCRGGKHTRRLCFSRAPPNIYTVNRDDGKTEEGSDVGATCVAHDTWGCARVNYLKPAPNYTSGTDRYRFAGSTGVVRNGGDRSDACDSASSLTRLCCRTGGDVGSDPPGVDWGRRV